MYLNQDIYGIVLIEIDIFLGQIFRGSYNPKVFFPQKVGPICLSDDLHVSPQNVEQYLQGLKHV